MSASPEFLNAVARFEGAVELLHAIPAERLRGARFLDIGCGQGNLLLAGANAGVRSATGIDIDLNCFGYDWRREIAAERNIDLGVVETPIEADFCDYPFASQFDVITCLDVLEHVSRPAACLRKVASCLAPGGIALLDVSPLYYSQIGHHLWPFFPRETLPWAHLYRDFDHLLREANPEDWYLRHFRGLNRITASEARSLILASGLEIVSSRINSEVGREAFVRIEGRLDPEKLPADREDLFTEWMRFELTRQ